MLTEVRAERGTYTFRLSGMRGGGQAVIYRADGPPGSVAIKIARDPRDNPWLARERDTLLALQRVGAPWVIPILDHGDTPDGRIFLVLPWFEHTLRDWLDADPPLGARLLAMTQACEAVIHLHRSADDISNIRLHRDIKPSNFLVRTEPALQVLLADLGGVKEGDLLSLGQQTAMHTPHFAPPEQELPIDRPLDPSADVHSLGVTLYWAIVGDVPRAVYLRKKLYTDEVQQLLALHRRRRHMEAAEGAAYRRLRTLPLRALFDLDAARALLQTDRSRFRQHLVDLLSEEVEDPAPAAEQLSSLLLPPLERTLAPDPERRSADARPLLAACRKSLEYLGIPPAPAADPAQPLPPRAPAANPPPDRSDLETLIQRPEQTPRPTSARRRWEVALATFLGLGIVALVALRGVMNLRDDEAGSELPPGPGADGPPADADAADERVASASNAAPAPASERPVADPTATDPTATDPTATSPTATTPAATTPAATSPAATGPATISLAAITPKATTPAATGPVATGPVATRPTATEPAADGSEPNLGAVPRLFLRPGGDGAATLVIGGVSYPDKYSRSLTEPLSITLALDGAPLCILSASSTPAGAGRWEVSVGGQEIQAGPGQTVVARYTHNCAVDLSLK